jgi:hypothetical protein
MKKGALQLGWVIAVIVLLWSTAGCALVWEAALGTPENCVMLCQ